MRTVKRIMAQIVEEQGWQRGTSLENEVAFLLAKYGFGPAVINQQYRIGKYTVDFAHVDKRIVVEADGWHHRSPEGAAKDAERDSWLRSQDWLVLRVDDRYGTDLLGDQVGRVVRWMHGDDWAEGRPRHRERRSPRRSCGIGWPW